MATNERLIPEAALRDPDAVEVLRVWIAEKGLHCSMMIGMYHETTEVPEEAAWARILADVARHVANAMAEGYRKDAGQTLLALRRAFDQEFNEEPLNIRGGFVGKPNA